MVDIRIDLMLEKNWIDCAKELNHCDAFLGTRDSLGCCGIVYAFLILMLVVFLRFDREIKSPA